MNSVIIGVADRPIGGGSTGLNEQSDCIVGKWREILKPFVIQQDVQNKYHFQEALGEGSYGKVYLA